MSRDLAAMQQAMAELIRTGDSTSDDAYVAAVRSSAGLRILRECIAEWRELVLRRACPLTTARLRSRGTFEAAVRRLLERECPPFLRDLALTFLEDVAAAEPELRAVAEFEARMIRASS
jgi:hypothetical protein